MIIKLVSLVLLVTACKQQLPEHPVFGEKSGSKGGASAEKGPNNSNEQNPSDEMDGNSVGNAPSPSSGAPNPAAPAQAQQPTPQPQTQGPTPPSPAPVQQPPTASLALMSDASLHTFGSFKVATKLKGAIQTSLYLYGPGMSEAMNLASTKLVNTAKSCSHIYPQVTGPDLVINWVGHYDASVEGEFSFLRYDQKPLPSCVAKLVDPSGVTEYLVFDFAQKPMVNYVGTASLSAAKDKGGVLLLVDPKTAFVFQTATAKKLEQGKRAIKLKSASVANLSFVRPPNENLKCYQPINIEAKNRDLGNKSRLYTSTATLTGAVGFKMTAAAARLVDGTYSNKCNLAKLSLSNTAVSTKVYCDTFFKVEESKAKGAEECVWGVAVQNTADSDDAIELPIRLPKIENKKVSYSDFAAPQSANNAVRSGQMVLKEASASEKDWLLKLIDFWIAAAPKSYAKASLPTITEWFYADGEEKTELCGAGPGAPPGLTGPAANGFIKAKGMYICSTTFNVDLLHASGTIFHENRHNSGLVHDGMPQGAKYAACGGASSSGELAYELFTECKSDLCEIHRDSALKFMAGEIHYNYSDNLNFGGDGTDPRMYQGQCKTWLELAGPANAATLEAMGNVDMEALAK